MEPYDNQVRIKVRFTFAGIPSGDAARIAGFALA